MDITEQSPTVLSLCSGYGGLEIGLKRVFGKIAVLAHVEIEAFAVANLVNKMETQQMAPVPIWTDVKTFDAKPFRGCVDILTGGYPCQPFSVAGQRKGADDPRHLWPHIRRIIGECRPGWIFLENVEGHLTKGITEVLSDLEKMAYRPECGVFSAAEVGAPHQRKRVFILAHDDDGGRRKSEICPKQPRGTEIVGASENAAHNTSIGWGERWPESARQQRRSGASSGSCEGSAQLGDAESNEQWRMYFPTVHRARIEDRGSSCDVWPAGPGQQQHAWEAPRTVADTPCQLLNWRGTAGPSRWRELTDKSRELADSENVQREEKQRCPKNRILQKDGQSWQTQSKLGRAVDGNIDRVDRLRLLGNGVVPQTAEKAFCTLYHKLFDLLQ